MRTMRRQYARRVTRRDIRFVTIKSAEQQSLQSVDRMRERLVQERTAKSNQIRSMFAEEGIVFGTGLPQLRKGIVALIDDASPCITPLLRRLGSMYLEQLKVLQQWLDEINSEIAAIFKRNEACQRLATIPGVGPLIATALVSCVGDPSQFRNGRQFAAWLGLTPKQRSSGGKTRLGGITKRGDTYLRTLLVQGSRAVMHFVNRREDRHSLWIRCLMQRRHASIAAIALANKTARIAWSVLTREETFRAAGISITTPSRLGAGCLASACLC